jgi:hypothetical protein
VDLYELSLAPKGLGCPNGADGLFRVYGGGDAHLERLSCKFCRYGCPGVRLLCLGRGAIRANNWSV